MATKVGELCLVGDGRRGLCGNPVAQLSWILIKVVRFPGGQRKVRLKGFDPNMQEILRNMFLVKR